jgi:hypothetical protein
VTRPNLHILLPPLNRGGRRVPNRRPA